MIRGSFQGFRASLRSGAHPWLLHFAPLALSPASRRWRFRRLRAVDAFADFAPLALSPASRRWCLHRPRVSVAFTERAPMAFGALGALLEPFSYWLDSPPFIR